MFFFVLFIQKRENRFFKKIKKTYAKNLTFQMQRCKQTALTLQSTRLHSITKRINMEDSQRPTWRTKTWFYPIFKCNKNKQTTKNELKRTIDSFLFIREFIRGNHFFSVSVLKPLMFSCRKPRPALLSLNGGKVKSHSYVRDCRRDLMSNNRDGGMNPLFQNYS